MRFSTIRFIVITLLLLSQTYIYLRLRKVVISSAVPKGLKLLVLSLSGLVISLLFVGNVYLLSRPVPWIDPPTWAQLIFFYPPAVWTFGSLFTALLLFASLAIGQGMSLIALLCRKLTAASSSCSTMDPGRRRFLGFWIGGVASAPLLLSTYGAAYGRLADEAREITLPFGHPLLVVQLSDIHAGIYMNGRQMRRYVKQVMALEPDLFVITGDFISNSLAFLPRCLEELARVRTRYGIFASLGNHEHWYADLEDLKRIFRQYRIPLLLNAHQVIRTARGEFAVAGIDDLMAGYPDLDAALKGLDAAIPTILLSHHPEIFPQAAARGVALTLSGHYHGGQIKVGNVRLVPLRTPYPEGLYRIDNSHLYVNRGIGTTFTPIRINVPPEVSIFHLS